MNMRASLFLVGIGLLMVVGCGQPDDSSSVSKGPNEKTVAGSLDVEVRPMADTIRSGVSLNFQGKLERARFPRRAEHSLFTTNGRYLVWKTVHTDTLFMYDLRARRITHKFRIPRGEGPGEFETLSGATITDDDVVYLAEPNQGKFLRFEATKGPLEDLTFYESGFRPERVDAWGTQLVASIAGSVTISHPNLSTGLVGIISSDGVFRAAEGLNVKEEFGRSLAYQAPRLDATRQRAFYLTRYRPRIYVFDLERNRFAKEVEYGDVEIEMPDPEKTESGGKVLHPPRKVQFFAYKVMGISGRPNRVLVQAEGGDEQHTFTPSAFYEIDVPTGTIVAEHDLGVKINKVAQADGSLFVYDDEKREVFKYRLLPAGRLDEDVIEQAKEYAARRDTSVSQLVEDYFARLVDRRSSEEEEPFSG